ncbi:Sulfate transporter, CysZ-type [hydrothermal vent metagenome]|uniref:Sulfate transporter, CysZ-type n=1 Tax=hydrothermal vent metagenome TaxID=652676 RepID=A0A3B0ZIM5_9ZZZZ
MIAQPFIGASYLLRGYFMLFKPGIRGFVVVPMLINIIIFSLLIWFGISQIEVLLDYVMGNLPEWLQWLDWLLWLVFLIAFLLVSSTICLHLALLVAAPFNGVLSEAVEKQLDPSSTLPESSWSDIARGVAPAIISEAGKFGYFISRAIPLTVLFFIPFINIFAPAIWFIFAAWMLALEYSDYPLSNHGVLFKDSKAIVKEKRFVAFGFGSASLFCTLIPLVNFFVMPAAVAGATIMYVEQLKGSVPPPVITHSNDHS